MNEAILIELCDWEGLYVNGVLIDEGHTINQGYSRMKYLQNLAKEHNFDLNEMKSYYLTNGDDEDCLEEFGYCLPQNISELNGMYEKNDD
jgi:hypothetical protein